MTQPRAPSGAPPAASGDLRYRAFISYSHRDSRAVQRLHRRLESFAVPPALRRPAGAGRPVPANLRPIFRDRDELASASRLSDTIEAALDQSEALVVVCSPSAVASRWVNAEISYFRRRHPHRPVFAFVVAGDPGLDPRTQPLDAALPLALALDDPDAPEGKLGEPVAADARAEGDGFANACLKLIAGLLGVGYDLLRQREARRIQQRWMLAGGASIALSAVFAFLAWQATVARDQARAAQARAELELQSEQQTRGFLLSVFQLADANESRGNQVTVREVLDRAVERIDRTEFARPVIRSRFLSTLGQAYSSLGLNRRSAELLQASIDAVDGKARDPVDRAQLIDSRLELAEVYHDMGDYDAVDRQLLAIAGSGDAPSKAQRVGITILRGEIESYRENDGEAGKAYRQALSLVDDASLDREGAALARANALDGLARLALFAGQHAEAEQRYAGALAGLVPVVGDTHPVAISLLVSRGSNAYAAGRREQARTYWRSALDGASKVYDPLSAEMGTLKNNLGLLLLEDGDLKDAEPLLRDALASDRKHRIETFDDLAYPLANLGYTRSFLGDADEALSLFTEALAIARAHDHAMTGAILNGLADIHCSREDPATGLAFARDAVADAGKRQAPGHWRISQAALTLGYCRARAGEDADLAELARHVAVIRKKLGARSPFTRRGEAQARFAGQRSNAG